MVANREPCEPTVKALFDSAFTVFSLSFQGAMRTVNHVNALWVSRTYLRARLIQFSKSCLQWVHMPSHPSQQSVKSRTLA